MLESVTKRLYSQGKTHAIIYICIGLGAAAFALSVFRHDSTGLAVFLTFLTAMSGVQATRSVMSDKFPVPPTK